MVLLAFLLNATAGLAAYLVALVVILGISYVQLRRLWRGRQAMPIDGREVLRFGAPLMGMMITSAGFQNIDMLA